MAPTGDDLRPWTRIADLDGGAPQATVGEVVPVGPGFGRRRLLEPATRSAREILDRAPTRGPPEQPG